MKHFLVYFLLLTILGLVKGNVSEANAEVKDESTLNIKATKNSIEFKAKLRSIFGDKEFTVEHYDEQLKSISADSGNFFVSHDGRYLFAGPIYDTDKNIDIVEERQRQRRQSLLKEKPNQLFVQYPSSTKKRYSLTVFTAINCPYCRKLHNSIGELNQNGISVNYVMLPRGDVNSAPYAKTLSALCSDNPSKAVTRAMMNHSIEPQKCSSIKLDTHIKLASELKVNSTPTFILPDGTLQVGYVNTERLIALLEGLENETN